MLAPILLFVFAYAFAIPRGTSLPLRILLSPASQGLLSPVSPRGSSGPGAPHQACLWHLLPHTLPLPAGAGCALLRSHAGSLHSRCLTNRLTVATKGHAIQNLIVFTQWF